MPILDSEVYTVSELIVTMDKMPSTIAEAEVGQVDHDEAHHDSVIEAQEDETKDQEGGTKDREDKTDSVINIVQDPIDSLYESVRMLKQGGEGRVKILRRRSTRQLAISKSSWRRRGADNEVNILQLVHKHPQIVDFHDLFESTGAGSESHLVLGYCQGGDLDDLRDRFKRHHMQMPEPLIWHFYGQLAEAMHWLHDSCDVVHRDLKPGNVLVVAGPEDGSYPGLKVADFGFACVGEQPAEESHVGTPMWWGPEERPGTKAQDMWAVGAIVHWLVLRTLPVDAAAAEVSRDASRGARRRAAVEAPRVVRSICNDETVQKYVGDREGVEKPTAYSRELDGWMRRALEADPGSRITAKELCGEFLKRAKEVVARDAKDLPDWVMPDAPLDDWGSDNSPEGFAHW